MTGQKFCTRCGSPLAPGQRFCTACGASVAPASGPFPASGTSGAQAPTPAPVPSPAAPPKKGHAAAIVITIVLVVALIGGIFAVLVATDIVHVGSSDDTPTESSTSETAQESPSEGLEGPIEAPSADSEGIEQDAAAEADAYQPEESAQSDASSASESAAPSQDSGTLSLDNEEDYYQINLCLSNLSEIGSVMNGYRADSTSGRQVFQFAYLHALLNSTKAVEYGEYWPGGRGDPYFERTSFGTLQKYAELFLKQNLTTQEIPADAFYDDGYVYTSYQGMGPEGIALATGIQYLGDNQYQVEFEVYAPSYSDGYSVTDSSYYRMTPEQLAAEFGRGYPSYLGTAVIEAGYPDKDAPFKPISFDMTAV